MALRYSLFHVDNVTRDIIYEWSIGCRHRRDDQNRAIRHALGFRETGKNHRGRPMFAAGAYQVIRLYDAISELTKKLPQQNVEQLRRAWKEGRLLQVEIKELVDIYGQRIWGVPQHSRHLRANPNSHLLVGGEADEYPTDLFIEVGKHRR